MVLVNVMGSTTKSFSGLDSGNKEENSDKSNDEEMEDLDWTPDQEILLLYSLHGLKPVGPHKHFRMILIQERFSNAMNKSITPAVIWKKLNCWYDMEALDEAEAEADAASSVEIDFELPAEEYGDMLEQKQKGLPVPKQNLELKPGKISESEMPTEIQSGTDTSSQDQKAASSDGESSKESGSSKGVTSPKSGRETPKRGTKRTFTPVKDNTQNKKDNIKEISKKDTPKKEEIKKTLSKEEDKKESSKKLLLDVKKDEKKDNEGKINKKDLVSKKQPEQAKKEVETKKPEPKKPIEPPKNQRETPKSQKNDSSTKRGEVKSTRSEVPKEKAELKKELNSDKKKEVDKKVERKSPEKTPESAKSGKLRARKEVDSETPLGTKRAKESMSKATDSQPDEPPAKKVKTPVIKGRPTRNSMEPQKPLSPASSPQKRRSRIL